MEKALWNFNAKMKKMGELAGQLTSMEAKAIGNYHSFGNKKNDNSIAKLMLKGYALLA